MNQTLEKLKNYGCEIKTTLSRFLDDEEFYFECVKDVLVDEDFELLGNALAENKIDAAFDAAHTLKGVLSNTGLIPLYDEIIKIVEPLRKGRIDGLMVHYEKLMKKKAELKTIIEV